MLGYPIRDWLTRSTFLAEILHPEDREPTLTRWHRAIEGHAPEFEFRVIAADGSVRRLRNTVTVHRDPAGAIERLSGFMVDLAEIGGAVAASQSESYQQLALEYGVDVLIITDRQAVIEWVSPSGQAVLGRSSASWSGRTIFELFHPDDAAELHRLLAAAFASGASAATVLVRYRHPDGSWRMLEAASRSVGAEECAVAVISTRDVTARAQQDGELRRVQKMEALARVTSAVAHDFNNLLMVIHGNADVALHTALDEQTTLALTEILQAAEIGKALTEQLQTFGGRQRRVTVVDVNATVQQVRPLLERILRPVATLTVDAAAVNSRVLMENGTLQQILLNLVMNAREALRGEGRVSVTTRNAFLPSRPGNQAQDVVEIEVADTGVGMSPEIRDHVFELYFTTKHDRRGSGIGLATVYAFVRDAGGSISVDSEPGEGSRFRIRLPVVVGR